MSEELKPCPFCGSHAYGYRENFGMNGSLYFIQCNGCTAQVSAANDRAACVAEWNRRPAAPGRDEGKERGDA